ncbi:hypothetical protein [uncultured Acetobacteroides sp.]|uniref:hypothetical protein n=1 Tax=uncultured Acetobacteroides sp. TaxID=1760811 RepID=UPI0029F50E1A|nr:hypothetical protein [uncultured Acetobacteroides sp.]
MKSLKAIVAVLGLSLLGTWTFSCTKDATIVDDGKLTGKYLIAIDSIKVPEKITANNAFDIQLYGYVGPTGCYHFANFDIAKMAKTVNVEIWGQAPTEPVSCTQALVFLNGEKLNLKLEEKGTYLLRFKRPNGTYFEESITVG